MKNLLTAKKALSATRRNKKTQDHSDLANSAAIAFFLLWVERTSRKGRTYFSKRTEFAFNKDVVTNFFLKLGYRVFTDDRDRCTLVMSWSSIKNREVLEVLSACIIFEEGKQLGYHMDRREYYQHQEKSKNSAEITSPASELSLESMIHKIQRAGGFVTFGR